MTCRTTPSSNRLPLILLVPIIEEQTESPKPCKSLSKLCVHCLFIVQRCAGTVARNNNSLSILRDLSQQHPAFSYCFNFDSLFCCIIKGNAFLRHSPSYFPPCFLEFAISFISKSLLMFSLFSILQVLLWS